MATETMTRADAARSKADRELMRNAARNLRFCEMRAMGTPNVKIAQEAGLSPSRTSRIISKGEAHWQMWLERAIEEGIDQEEVPGSVPEPDGAERVEMIDIRLIGDNPFQPRTKFTADEVKHLMDDILANGQRIPVTIRPSVHDETLPYELCWGQLRLEALREAHDLFIDGFVQQFGEIWGNFHDRATGVTRIKAIIQEMDDTELRKGAASENLNRNSMCWSDTIRALDDICENTDSTAAEVAALAKMSPQQLSNQRRLLRLPREILDMVDEGVLAWTSARELLVFATPHHTHQEELDYCVRRLGVKMRVETDGEGNRKRIDARSVRHIIANAVCHGDHPDHWEYVGEARYSVYLGDGNTHGKRLPMFDREAFAQAYKEWVHSVPGVHGGSYATGSEKWTCAVESWHDWQKVALEEERRAEEEAAEAADRLGAVATAFSNENPRAEKLPREILHMLEDGRLSHSFVHRLLGFVDGTHAHEEYLEEICDGLRAISAENPHRVVQDAAAGGIVLKALRKKLAYTEFRSLDDRLTNFGFEAPRFAMDEFIESQRPVIHNVPIGIGIVRVTCSYRAWDEFQENATEAVKQQAARGNQPVAPVEEPAAQLMDMSIAEATGESGRYWEQAPLLMVPKCAPESGDHWHVMVSIKSPGFSDKARRSPALWAWDDVMQCMENLTDDGGATAWVEEHVYEDVRSQ